MNSRKSLVFGLFISLLVALLAVPAIAATIDVPEDYDTITDALAAADPGDSIDVAYNYEFITEEFPILVQKDGITIDGNGAIFDLDVSSHAVFAVGAKRVLDINDTWVREPVSDVTIKNFRVRGVADIGFVVKHAENVTIRDNVVDASAENHEILEGIRLVDAAGSTIEDNTITAVGDKEFTEEEELVGGHGIGIFLQNSGTNADGAMGNQLSGNKVTQSGLGLFVYNSDGNEVSGDTYESNLHGGFVLNDSQGNELSGLELYKNGYSDPEFRAWGARFVHADENDLLNSEIYDNSWGGVQLLGSSNNTVDGNLIYNNGTGDDGSDDAQMVVSKGDKAEFSSDIVEEFNNLGYLSEFVNEKHQVEDKLDWLEGWIDDLNLEMDEIRQKLATAIGMHEQGDPQYLINTFLDDEVVSEKLAIEEGKIQKLGDTDQLIDEDSGHSVKFTPGSDMGDPAKNFSLENSTHPHRAKLDEYTDDGGNFSSKFNGPDFGLDYTGGSTVFDPSSISIDLVEVIDTSGSMSQDQLDLEVEGIRDAIDNVLRPLVAGGANINIGIVEFSDSASVVQTASSNMLTPLAADKSGDLVDERLNSVSSPGGLTNVEDALMEAQTVLDTGEADESIVDLSSDGVPTTSESGGDPETDALNQADAMKNTGTAIWPIGVKIDPGSPGGLFLENLAGPDPATASFAETFQDYNTVVEEKTEKIVEPANDYSWSKLDLINILLHATKNEVWNDWDVDNFGVEDKPNMDSLKEKIKDWRDMGIITDQDYGDLKEKLDAILGYLAQIREIVGTDQVDERATVEPSQLPPVDEMTLREKLQWIDIMILEYIETGEKQYLLDAKNMVEEFILQKEEIYGIIEDIRYKLCLVDIELPPFPKVNTELLAKKEKPGGEITEGEISDVKGETAGNLEDDSIARDIREAVGADEWTLTAGDKDVLHSVENTISSNVLFTRVENNDGSKNFGMVVESPRNHILNNLITNEKIEPIYDETAYEEFGRMDVGIFLLSNENELMHNAFEWVNLALKRGGEWERHDYQLEYTFNKMAEVAYWPNPGYEISDDCGTFGEEHFEKRPIDWVPVLGLQGKDLTVSRSARIYRNEIALNLFEKNGIDIDVVDAESNDIYENLFVNSGTAAIKIHEGSFGIRINENDFVHTLLQAIGTASLAASDNYGEDVEAFGNVTPPAADAPFCPSNFKNEDNFTSKGLGKYFDSKLPPNTGYLYSGVVLPDEKVRVCSDVFDLNTQVPSAAFSADPTSGNKPLSVSFDASASTDNDDVGSSPQIVEYKWDFDNDGNWDLTTSNPAASHDYNSTGSYSVKLKVTDNDGESDTLTKENLITVGDVSETCFSVTEDWNLISMPVEPSDKDPNAVFDEVPGTLYLWEYVNGNGNWLTTHEDGDLTSVDSLGGYYLWLPEGTAVNQICTSGAALTGNQSLALGGDSGWKQIGVPYPVQWGDDGTITLSDGTNTYNLVDAVNNGWINNQIWEFNSSTQSFEVATVSDNKTLEAHKGYWLFAEVGGLTINFSETGGPGKPPTPATAIELSNVSQVTSTPPIPGLPSKDVSADALEVSAVSQAERVTFQVSGEGARFVSGLKVQVFDAGGRQVKVLESSGDSVSWNTEGVANGAYLFVASANTGNGLTQTNIGKVLLLN